MQVDEPPIRPNPYVYLDKILRNTTRTFPPIINFPHVVLQIDNADSSRSMRELERGRATVVGAIYPDDRRILVSDIISTVIQFRNLDYAMEDCILNMSLPFGTTAADINIASSSVLDVWILDESEELAQNIRHGAALARAPERSVLLATLPFPTSGSQLSQTFRCPSGGFTTIEMACAHTAGACHVDFWQDRRAKPVGGVFMVQYSTPVESEGSWP